MQVLMGLFFTIFQSSRMSVWFMPKVMKSCLNMSKLWSKYCRSLFSQPSIYIDGWLYGMSMTSVTFRCCLKTIPHIIILSSRHESDIPIRYLDAKFHHPSLGASPPNRGKSICLPPELSLLLKRRGVNKFTHRYSMYTIMWNRFFLSFDRNS